MNLSDIVVVLGGNAILLSVAGYVLKGFYENRVKFDYDKRLEQIKSELDSTKIEFQNRLSQSSNELNEIRSVSLESLKQNRQSLNTRRFQAVEEVWESVLLLSGARGVATNIATLKLENVSELINENQGLQDIVESFGAGYDPAVKEGLPSQKSRPFVTDQVWANYKAYETICFVGVLKWEMLRRGMYNPEILDHEAVKKVIKTALPELSHILDENWDSSYRLLLDELENRILTSMRLMLSGVEDDETSTKRAIETIKASNQAYEQSLGAKQA